MANKPLDAIRLEIGGRRMLELSIRRLSSGETIIFPRLSGFGKHLSIYFPTKNRIATHVTHQYAFGRQRHTRRRLRESGKVIRDLFAALAPPDLPPPRASFFDMSARAEWSGWLALGLHEYVLRADRHLLAFHDCEGTSLVEERVVGGSSLRWVFLDAAVSWRCPKVVRDNRVPS